MFGTRNNAAKKKAASAKACGIKLGGKARDTVTGFEGIVTSITRWLNGCDRIGIQPTELDEKGQPKEAHVFDALQLEPVSEPEVKPIRSTGGPRHEEKR